MTRYVHAVDLPTLGVMVRIGDELGTFLPLAYPHPTYNRVDVVGYDVNRAPVEATVVTGTPSLAWRIPPLPHRFVPLAWIVVEAAQTVIPQRSIWDEPDPRWTSTPITNPPEGDS